MAKLGILAGSLLLVAQLSAFAAPLEVDLDAPGALEALARSNPADYAKVQRIVAEVGAQPDAKVGEWLRVNFSASSVAYPPLLKTSYPAKRRLTFSLGFTTYTTLLTVQEPARARP